MNIAKLVVAWLVVGVVMNVFDALFHGVIMMGYYTQLTFMRQDTPMTLMVVADFVFALVFVLVYDRLYAGRECRMGRGIHFGFWVGLLLNFPGNIMMHLMIKGFPYGLSWVFTIVGIVEMVVLGAIAGALYAKKAAATRAEVVV
jgi:hypothetical protein